MSEIRPTTDGDGEEPIVTCSELLEQIEDEEAELDRERALYGNCDIDICTYPQVNPKHSSVSKDSFFYLRDMFDAKLYSLVKRVLTTIN